MRKALLALLVATPALANVPENLDRAAISEGVSKVKAKIIACGDNSTASGIVKLKVNVAPDGSVSSAVVDRAPDKAVGDCAAAAMKQATFKATQKGGTFGYPFVFGSGKSTPTPPPAPGDTLDRAAISEGVAKVKGEIQACNKVSSAKGTVKVKVDVAPAGNVSNIGVQSAPDAALGKCVADAMKKATFKKTEKGGSFSYPFVF